HRAAGEAFEEVLRTDERPLLIQGRRPDVGDAHSHQLEDRDGGEGEQEGHSRHQEPCPGAEGAATARPLPPRTGCRAPPGGPRCCGSDVGARRHPYLLSGWWLLRPKETRAAA